MMQPRFPNMIEGRAIDDESTKQCHQIFSISHEDDLNMLHYSICRPSGKMDVDKLFIENLCDVFSDTKGLLTPQGKQRANDLFGQLVSKIKIDKKSYFVLNESAPAITFDIGFNKSFDVESIDFRLTTAKMTEKISCTAARTNIMSDNPDQDLKLWHDLVVYQKYEEMINRKLSFHEVTNNTTIMIQRYMCDYTVKNKLGCIFKVVPEVARTDKGYERVKSSYGSTLNFDEQIRIIGEDYSRAFVQATASREAISSLNMASLSAYKEEGIHLYTPDFLNSVVNYKMTCQKLAA